ncbi:type I restriction endonuclease subunit R [Streptomyces dysideae]|uniref:Restriction endonuclease subunit R n=1 Tax=Streptomyces dysideae TaxID=909626 RepID=A0A117S130_9ACTN|nr:type I restriction endonuclease [Streptomyces dysideae]KUO20857.1 restriction endonuclease subunit R [Streptomyces dysideae]
MSPVHHESAFGDAIVAALREHGWEEASPTGYRPELGFDTNQLFTFIGATQPTPWNELLRYYGGDPNAAQRGFVKRLDRAIADADGGVLQVLRDGVKDQGVRIRLAYFKPSLVESESILANYHHNRLTVVRELEYATKQADRGHRLDLTLFLNGIPLATAELKNPLTGQNVEDAKKQYRTERDPSELIFTRRVVANFAVDPDLVFVATQLRGEKTWFLPFNTGSEGPGHPGGAGNPSATEPGTYATSHLWEQIWQRDNWLELLERFVHLHKETDGEGKAKKSLIFPRFHQWHAVRELTSHAARHGSGHNYLVMASAGSGKSNTIAWLAHRLSSLHTLTDASMLAPDAVAAGLLPGKPVFDKVVIITDRTVLDRQLQDTVGSFEQTAGLVVKVKKEGGAKSEQLAAALSQETGKIVIVTLQTFPALIDYLQRTPTEIKGRRFAIVIDEAHSSQSGDAATAVRKTLRDLGLDADSEDDGAVEVEAEDGGKEANSTEARLKKNAADRGQSPNLSYFAFTATPKAKTLELFGTLDMVEGKETYRPFHTYSMKQAIEEGFILDPLKNYVTYDTYWKLVNKNPDDREVDPAKANPLLARYALTHASTVAQHAQVIVEHFKEHTAGRLGGRAKAMVVTASRQSAVQMARSIKKYIGDRDYQGIGVLVAFSGTLTYDGDERTESKENGGLAESALPKAFAYTRADDKSIKSGGPGKPEYRILVVAEKYQTGFDQPLLTTMYVNKKLGGVSAVQTLSRLNRTAERKSQSDLAVLDFVNDADDVQGAFIPYFAQAMTLPSDPNLLYTAQGKVMKAEIVVDAEMEAFVEAYLAAQDQAAGNTAKWERLHAELYRLTDPARDRFAELLEDEGDKDKLKQAEDFRADLNGYVRMYGFLAQIVPYSDPELERLYLFGRHLLNRLPRREDAGVDIGQVDLTHLKVQKTGEHDKSLTAEGPALMKGMGDGSGGAKEPEQSMLSELIERFNDKFGTGLTTQDVLPAFEEAVADKDVRQAALGNESEEKFGHVFEPVFEEKMMDHITLTAEMGRQYFSPQPDFRSSLNRSARSAAWRMIRDSAGLDDMT